jgi:hypothetical protein
MSSDSNSRSDSENNVSEDQKSEEEEDDSEDNSDDSDDLEGNRKCSDILSGELPSTYLPLPSLSFSILYLTGSISSHYDHYGHSHVM